MFHFIGELTSCAFKDSRQWWSSDSPPASETAPGYPESALLQTFVLAGDGGDVELPQFLAELAQGGSSLGIRRPLVGLLQPPTSGRLLSLREIPHHVLAFVPLTTLDQGLGAEHRMNGGAKPLSSVDDAEQAWLYPQPTLQAPLTQPL